jgi:hypothetical protein
MNILGEGFPDVIIQQVEQRQKVYGSGYNSLNPRTPENPRKPENNLRLY